jgi:5'-3' exonuclease
VKVYLLDGTYELFRHYFALPSHLNRAGQEVAGTRGVLNSVLSLIGAGAKYIAVATDHVVESFRNDLWPDYKDSSGIEEELLSQFGLLENSLRAMGVVVWPMVEYEADDALAAGAAMAAADERVEQVLVCTPDKDLAQCVVGERIVQFDRRKRAIIDEDGVIAKFGVAPKSIPDYLGLVGDAADGFPGLPGWGAKSTAAVLARYRHIEEIPRRAIDWEVEVRGAERLASTLVEGYQEGLLFRKLATLVVEGPIDADVDRLKWCGPNSEFVTVSEVLEDEGLAARAVALADR